jgi:hypothetical protein
MTISAIIPIEYVEQANAELDELGFGPNSFSVPVRSGSSGATHAGLHSWNNDSFLSALQSLNYTGLVIKSTEDEEVVSFPELITEQAMEWESPERWYENPVMKDDERTKDGKTWVSLMDYNVWEPPVGWREVVSEGYPAWVQPTGAHDAYPLRFRVTHKGQDWENTGSAANVWEPGVFGWVKI